MSLLGRKRAELEGIDPNRVPPGQYVTERFPVLHAGVVPKVDLARWDFRVEGLVASPRTWSYEEIRSMPATEKILDIHCVTKWSKLDTRWEGVSVAEVMSRVELEPAVTHVLVQAEQGFTANIPLPDFTRAENLFAYRFGPRAAGPRS
jgi:DMSO/TMAO reductase YedYZ molybdopterin-dependent catalytic subunit